MNRHALLPALALALLAAGCTAEPVGTVVIYQACYPPKPSDTGICSYPTGTCTSSPLDTYALDVAVANDFFLGVEVHNLLEPGNTHDAFVDGYTVSYSLPGIPDTDGTSSIQNTVPAGGSSVVGVRLADATAIAALASYVATNGPARMVATLKLHGKYGDYSEFESGSRTFGIDVCSGCIVPSCAAVCPGPGVSPYSCGDGGGSGTSYRVGGTITGTLADQMVLHCDGLNDLTVPVGAHDFAFAGSLPDGTNYLCNIASGGTGCTISSGASGTVSGADVAMVIACPL